MFRQLSSACLVTRTGGRSNLSSVPRPRHGPGRASGQRRGGRVQQRALPALHPRARPEDSHTITTCRSLLGPGTGNAMGPGTPSVT